MKRLLLAILLISPCVLDARSYFDAGLRAGLNGLIYDCEYGGTSPGYHVAADIGYLYKSPYWVAFRVGASIEAASSSYRKTDYEDQYTTIDIDNEKMRVQYTIGTLRERHQTYSVSFPLQVGFNIQQFTFLIGCGRMASFHAGGLNALGAEIVGVYDIDTVKAESFAQKFGVKKVCSTRAELLTQCGVELLLICDYGHQHAEEL